MSTELSKRIYKSYSLICFKILFLTVAGIILSGILLYELSGTPIASTYAGTISSIDTYKDNLIKNCIYIYSGVTVLIIFGVVIVCLKHSHGLAGPLKRFEDKLKMLADGDYDMSFSIRNRDKIQELAEVVNEIRTTYKDKHERLDKKLDELHTSILEFEKAVITCDTVQVEQSIRNLRSISSGIDGIFSELRL